jgi:hypothetical protein
VRGDGGDWGGKSGGLRSYIAAVPAGLIQGSSHCNNAVLFPKQSATQVPRPRPERNARQPADARYAPRRPPSRSKRNGACRATGRPELPLPLHSASDIDAHPTCLTSCYCQPSHTSRRAPIPDPLTCIKLSPSSPHAATDASCLAKLCQLALGLGVSSTASPPCPPIGRQSQLCLCQRFSEDRSKGVEFRLG